MERAAAGGWWSVKARSAAVPSLRDSVPLLQATPHLRAGLMNDVADATRRRALGMASLTRLGAGHEEWRRWRDSVLLFQAEAAVEVLDYSVTFAGGGFEVFAV
jgi:hypothetical protein